MGYKSRSDTFIKTERLFLRQIDQTDAEDIVSLRSDESVYRYFLNPIKLTVDDHNRWYKTSYIKDSYRIDWVAVDDNSGDFIGVYGAKKICDNTAEVSYITKQDKKGKGYATEAINEILKWCIRRWKTKFAVVVIHIDNTASIDFAKSMGFTETEKKDLFVTFMKEIMDSSKNVE